MERAHPFPPFAASIDLLSKRMGHGWFRNVPPLCYAIKEARGRKMSRLIFVRGVRTLGSLLSRYIIHRGEADVSRGGVGSAAAFPARRKRKKIISPKIWRAGKEECGRWLLKRLPCHGPRSHTRLKEGPLLGVGPLSGTRRPEREKRRIAFRDTFYYPRLM